MAFKILYTEKALADLEAILDYILADNSAAAIRFGNGLLNHIDLLATYPHIGSPVRRRAGMRKVLQTPKSAGVSKFFTSGTLPGRNRTGYSDRARRRPRPSHTSSAPPSFHGICRGCKQHGAVIGIRRRESATSA
jgi:plasmid stabilization system protein ParE